MIKIEELTRNERNVLLYAETCVVDHGGLLEGIRMNVDDYVALDALRDRGALIWGRIPSELLGLQNSNAWRPTHWVRLTRRGWGLAGRCRRERAKKAGPYSRQVWAQVTRIKRDRTWALREGKRSSSVGGP